VRRAGHAVGAAALVLGLLAALAAGQQPPQHVVVVVLDDVGVDKVGAYGHPTAGPTPVLDALAASGLRGNTRVDTDGDFGIQAVDLFSARPQPNK